MKKSSSMAAKDQSEVDLDIQALLMHMGDGSKDIDQKLDELMKKYNRTEEADQPILDEEKELAAKKFQEKPKKKRNVHFIMPQLHQPDEKANLEANLEEAHKEKDSGDDGVEDKMPSLTSSSGEMGDDTKELKKAESRQDRSVIGDEYFSINIARLDQVPSKMVLGSGESKDCSAVEKGFVKWDPYSLSYDLHDKEDKIISAEDIWNDMNTNVLGNVKSKQPIEEIREEEGSSHDESTVDLEHIIESLLKIHNDQSESSNPSAVDQSEISKPCALDQSESSKPCALDQSKSSKPCALDQSKSSKPSTVDQSGSSKPSTFNSIMLSVVHEFKKGRQEKSLVRKGLKGYVKSPEEWEAVEMVKNRVVMLGSGLCRLLVSLIFTLSEMEEMAEKFRKLNSFLIFLIEGEENSIVIGRIIDFLEFVDKEFLSTGGLKDVEPHGGISVTKKVESDGTRMKAGLFDQSQVNRFIYQFVHEILRLENILKRKPDSKISVKDLLSFAEADLKECEGELKRMDSRISELVKLGGRDFAPDDSEKYTAVEMKIENLWNSEEIGDLKRD